MTITIGDMVYWIRGNSEKLPADLKKSEQQVKGFGSAVSESLKTQLNFALGAVMSDGMRQLSEGLKRFTTDLINTTVEYSNQMQDLALITGASIEDTSRLFNVADDLRIQYSDLATGLRIYSDFLSRTGSKEDASVESLAKLSDQYLLLNEGVERTSFLIERFGARSGTELGKLLAIGSDALLEMNAAVDENLILTNESVKASEEYRLTLDNWEDSIQGLKLSLGETLLPILAKFLETIVDKGIPALEWIIEKFTNLPAPIQWVIVGLGGLLTIVAALAPQLLALGGIVKAIAGAGVLVALKGAIAGVIEHIAVWAVVTLPGLGAAITAFLTGPLLLLIAGIGILLFTIKEFGPAAWENFKGLYDLIRILIKGLSDRIKYEAKRIGINFIIGIGEGIAAGWGWLKGVIGQVAGLMTGSGASKTASSAAQGATTGAASGVTTYKSAVPLSVSVGTIQVNGSLSESERAWFTNQAKTIAVKSITEALTP